MTNGARPGRADVVAARSKARYRNYRLHRKTRRAVRSFRSHLQYLGQRAYPTKGQFAERLALEPGSPLDGRQNLIVVGATQLDASISHITQAYEGAGRLLSTTGGPSLPWSAMVLARTAFEGSLHILDLLGPHISPELQLARMAAQELGAISDSEKMNDEVPELPPKAVVAESLAGKRANIESWCLETGLTCPQSRQGKITTSAGEVAVFPFNMVDAAKSWWAPVGNHTYRWLCRYTHAGVQVTQGHLSDPLAAIDVANFFAVFATVTEAVWMAMDAYSRVWVGIPNNRVMRRMSNVKSYCGSVFDHDLPERPPEAGELEFRSIIESALESGLVRDRRWARNLSRRI